MSPPGILVVLVVILVSSPGIRSQEITWIDDMNNYRISESVEIGATVYILRAVGPPNVSPSYSIKSNYLIIRDASTGVVELSRKLDYETIPDHYLTVEVEVKFDAQRSTRVVSVFIEDANDQFPAFDSRSDSFTTSVSENLPVGRTVFSNIRVADGDTGNSELRITCSAPNQQGLLACETFGLVDDRRSTSEWEGHVTLRKPLDFETAASYQLTLEAFDGVNHRTQTFTIDVVNENDQPPKFTGQLSATVSESVQLGTVVLNVTAVDGDKGLERPVRYSLVSNPGGFFAINSVSGSIYTQKKLSSDDPYLASGYVKLDVKAGELVSGVVGNDSLTSTVATVTITVFDTNDNAPVFTPNSYQVLLEENPSAGTNLPAQIKVTDRDQGSNAEFELLLNNYNDIFEIQPKRGSKSVTAALIVKDGSKIDYELGQRYYRLELLARETRTTERLSSQASVLVNITDMNDNSPQFAQDTYTASVHETAGEGTSIITITATDADSGIGGPENIRYRLTGNGANRFHTNRYTGEVSVRDCTPPGSGNCLDFEQQKTYTLAFEAWDNFGEGNKAVTRLIINVLDDNDNSPSFAIPEYVSYIDEGQTVPQPEVKVQAEDRDVNSQITYRIVSGDPRGQWQIGSSSGIITATRPVDYEAIPGNQGYYQLLIEASDGQNVAVTKAKIYVRDINDHRPLFTNNGNYSAIISELSPPGSSVITVAANDQDSPSGPNGQIMYRIQSGGQDKFAIDQKSGLITVAPGAQFDADVQNKYTLYVIGSDQGQPQLSSTATVYISVLDSNNKNPYFPSTVTRVDVNEGTPVGQQVVTMTAQDPDSAASLRYSFIQPIVAQDPMGNNVNVNGIYNNMFLIDEVRGIVRVNSELKRSRVATWQAVVKVVDMAGGADQTATATLIINVRERNDRPPVFGPPWSPSNPYIDLNLREEQPVNTYVTLLVATDPADAISGFKIISNPGGYLKLEEETGLITIAKPIDYETIQNFEVTVVAIDSGEPPLSATATIRIQVTNTNDNSPVFSQAVYEVDVPENSPGGTSVLRVNATDLDIGDYGSVRYNFSVPTDLFRIDSFTGMITVAPGAILDREQTPLISLVVSAYDSPQNASVRRYTYAYVVVNLLDANDHQPMFQPDTYFATLVESNPVDTSVVRVTAIDGDTGPNAKLSYILLNGNTNNFFRINSTTGVIYTDNPLAAGVYTLTIGVRDMGPGGGTIADTATVTATVLKANNGAPMWINPAHNHANFSVLENQYPGIEIEKVIAIDNDTDSSGVVTYGFMYNGSFVLQTPDFQVNPYTGVITARRVFDRETIGSYTVELVARDSGNPVMQSSRFVTIWVDDVGDNDPEFKTDRFCCPNDYDVWIEEDAMINSYIGKVVATDKDTGDNAVIIYNITAGNKDGTFRLDSKSGNLTLAKSLDHEKTSLYRLTILASNPKPSVISTIPPECRCNNKSSIHVNIHVLDKNDAPPTFGQDRFNTCVSVDAEVGRSVYTMQATDPDTKSSANLLYQITALENKHPTKDDGRRAPNNSFLISPSNGTVVTNVPMSPFSSHYFDMSVRATDSGGLFTSASLLVWVTEPDTEITVTVSRPLDDVRDNIDKYTSLISEATHWGVVCVVGIRYHITDGGLINTEYTDILLHVIDGRTNTVIDSDGVNGVIDPDILNAEGIIAIKESYDFWDGFNIDPVLGAVIAIILLLLLALLLLCCLWFLCALCCADDDEAYFTTVPIATETLNPIWAKQKYYEDQELSMAVPGQEGSPKPFSIHGTYDNAAYGADEADARDIMGEKLADGTAKLVLPGKAITKETREETEFQLTSFTQQSQPAIANGHAVSPKDVHLETTLEKEVEANQRTVLNAAAIGVPAIAGPARPRLVNASTMTEGGIQYERTGKGSYEVTGAGYAASDSGYRPSRIGATLSRPTTPYAQSLHAFSMLNGDLDFVPVRGPVLDSYTPYDIDIEGGQRISTGVQTANLYSMTPQYQTYSASIPEDRRTEISLTGSHAPSWHGEEFPDGLYQGEIHLGSLRPPSAGPPAYQEEMRFTEYMHTYDDQVEYPDVYNGQY